MLIVGKNQVDATQARQMSNTKAQTHQIIQNKLLFKTTCSKIHWKTHVHSSNWKSIAKLVRNAHKNPLEYLVLPYASKIWKCFAQQTRHNSTKHPKETIKQCIPAKNSANITAKRSFSQKFQCKSSKSNHTLV